jgi:hypothetical protein
LEFGNINASVFAIPVEGSTVQLDGTEVPKNYFARVRAIDTSGNVGDWTEIQKTDQSTPLIDSTFIVDLTASRIKSGTIEAAEIVLGGANPAQTIIKSANFDGAYTAGATPSWSKGNNGWMIAANGEAVFGSASIRGSISASSIDLNNHNYWRPQNPSLPLPAASTFFKVGDVNKYMEWNGSALTVQGRLQAGDIYIPNTSSPVFSVTTAGALTATSANITGAIDATSGTFRGRLTSADIYIPNATSPVFSVTTTGALTATSANITGAIDATSGTFRGRLTSADIYIPNATSPVFSVTTTGALTATSATISGNISSSTITGSTLTLDAGSPNGLKIVGGYIQALYTQGVRIFNNLGTTETIINGDVINTDTISSSSVETTDLIAVDISASKSSTVAEDPTIAVSRSGSAANSWFIGFYTFSTGTEVGKVQYAAGNGSILYTTTSDKRLKTELNIQENILEKINSINLRYYHWNSDDDKNIFLGTYAQELHDIIPNAVSIGDYSNTFIENKEAKEKNIESSKAWGLDYSQVVPYLIGAIQQLSQKVDELESRMV